MKTAVLIPCYNEELTIGKVVRDFKEVLPHAEIYVYDNNSTDKTAEVARDAGAMVKREYRQGKGNVIRSMFHDIEADCYIMVDGDDTYPASFAPEFERLILEGRADMVVGDRLSSSYFEENKRLFHNGGNRLVRDMINLLFRTNLKDIMSGARAFSHTFVKSCPIVCKGFEIETEMTIFALEHNFNIVEKTISYQDRPDGSVSKLNTISDGLKVLNTIVKLYSQTKPIQVFSSLSAVSFLGGIRLIYSGRYKKYQITETTGTVIENIGIMKILIGMTMLSAGVISFFTGIVLGILNRIWKQDFEYKRNLTDSEKSLTK